MEKQITRDSKFRHVFGKVWKKESAVINVKIKASGSFIKGNAKFSVFPWETVGGALAVVPAEYTGKLPDKCPLIRSHQSNVVDAAFSPFDEYLLGTAARESVIKFWRVGEEFVKKADQTEPLFTLEGHKNRLQLLSFHPSVNNLLLSVAADKTQKLWDIQTQTELISLPSPDKEIMSTSWFENGKAFASSSKDKLLRIYDPRSSPSPLLEVQAHEGLNGFYVQYLENERILTSGTTKDSRYQLAVWDLRNLSAPADSATPLSPLACNTYTPYPSLYVPSYDTGTGLCYLTSRGDSILVYEVNNAEPITHSITKIVTPNYGSCFELPKRVCDVREGEVSRFSLLCKQSVETISIFVPRRTASTIFQEDIYPPVPSTVASNTTADWMNGVDKDIDLMSLKPADLPSIYEISEEKGGKSAEVERIKRLGRSGSFGNLISSIVVNLPVPEMTSGNVEQHLGGWSTPWTQRYLMLEEDEGLQVYANEDSFQVIFSISFEELQTVELDPKLTDQFTVNAKKAYRFKVESEEVAKKWVESITIAKSNYDHPSRVEKRSASASSPSSPLVNGNENISGDREGYLETLVTGTIYTGVSSWTRRWYSIEGKLLYCYTSNQVQHQHPLEKISLSKITAVIKSSSKDKPFTIKVLTQGQVLYLAADTEEDQNNWIHSLLLSSPLGKQMAFNEEDTSSHILNSATEGYVMRQSNSSNNNNNSVVVSPRGLNWEKVWLSSAGLYLLYFASEFATTPLEKFSIKDIKSVFASEDSTTDFVIEFNDGKSISHRANSINERNEWVGKLDFLRRQFVDMFDVFRISDEEVQSRDAINRIEANVIDPIEVKNGNCPLLIRIKGRRRIRIAMVECKATSLSKKSSFVLDAGRTLYQWNGSGSARVTRAKAADLANKIRLKERGGLSQMIVLDDGTTDDNPVFWKLLGGEKSDVPAASIADDDETPISIKIYRLYDSTVPRAKRIQLIHDSSRLAQKEFLDTKCTSVVDCNTEIFVWIGSQSKPYQRRLAMLFAKKLTQEATREKWTSITRIVENGETILFKERFCNYPGMLPINIEKQASIAKIAQSGEQEPIDIKLLHSRTKKEEISFGYAGFIRQIWKIENFEKTLVPTDRWGIFYQGDSYIIQYQYFMEGVGKDLFALFYWQGIDSSRNEKGTSAYITVDISGELGEADQQRVVQGKEPNYFLKIFNDSTPIDPSSIHYHQNPANPVDIPLYISLNDAIPMMTCFLGKDPLSSNSYSLPRLFSVFGDDENSCYPTEIQVGADRLNSRRCFVLEAKEKIYLWIGAASSPFSLLRSRSFASSFNKQIIEINERSETDDFWTEIGGKKEYFGSKKELTYLPNKIDRFFLVTNASGTVQVSEITYFSQDDLLDDHCAILDVFDEIFVWFGSSSSDLERQIAMETAIEYVKQSPAGHATDTPIFVCQSYSEPLAFTSHFRCWTKKNYPAKKKNEEGVMTAVEEVLQRYTVVTYSYEELLRETLPPNVNPTKLEQYLSQEEFEKVFKMTRAEYMKLPMWQAEKLKQEAKLF